MKNAHFLRYFAFFLVFLPFLGPNKSFFATSDYLRMFLGDIGRFFSILLDFSTILLDFQRFLPIFNGFYAFAVYGASRGGVRADTKLKNFKNRQNP